MTAIPHPSIKLAEQLTHQDYEEIKSLQTLCAETDHLALKLELDYKISQYEDNTGGMGELNEFLYYSGSTLIGYIGICGGEELEINGMTHPEYRRAGVFKKLFSLVCDELKRRGNPPALLLCDSRSEAGLRFVRGTGSVFQHAEHEMVLKSNAAYNPGHAVTLHQTAGSRANSWQADADGKTVGAVRLETEGGTGYIYGLEVKPAHRGKGYGRGLLLAAIQKLHELGMQEVRLQVFMDNARALHIYESSGFVTEDTMEYYLVQ
jgi:GNAT superfamily N-acetyltransferase